MIDSKEKNMHWIRDTFKLFSKVSNPAIENRPNQLKQVFKKFSTKVSRIFKLGLCI